MNVPDHIQSLACCPSAASDILTLLSGRPSQQLIGHRQRARSQIKSEGHSPAAFSSPLTQEEVIHQLKGGGSDTDDVCDT